MPIQCTWPGCTQALTRNHDLPRHVNTTHLQVDRFWCPINGCGRNENHPSGKSFPRKDKRNLHTKTVHPDAALSSNSSIRSSAKIDTPNSIASCDSNKSSGESSGIGSVSSPVNFDGSASVNSVKHFEGPDNANCADDSAIFNTLNAYTGAGKLINENEHTGFDVVPGTFQLPASIDDGIISANQISCHNASTNLENSHFPHASVVSANCTIVNGISHYNEPNYAPGFDAGGFFDLDADRVVDNEYPSYH